MAVINLEVYWPYWMIQHHIIVAIMQKQSYVYDEILHNFPFFFFLVMKSDVILFVKVF